VPAVFDFIYTITSVTNLIFVLTLDHDIYHDAYDTYHALRILFVIGNTSNFNLDSTLTNTLTLTTTLTTTATTHPPHPRHRNIMR
jgi:hypothetical protein